MLPKTGFLANFHRICGIQGETKSNREMLEYQLLLAAGLTEKQAREYKKARITVTKEVMIPADIEVTTKEPIKEVNVAVKLREDYPFLSDADCPDVLKILVANKITAYYNYRNGHERLFKSPSEGDIYMAVSDVVENYLENRLIHNELEFFKKHKKLLMRHPIFKQLKRDTQIQQMKAGELAKLMAQLKMNIWRNNKLVQEQPGSEFTHERLERIKTYEHEIRIVDRLLQIK